MQIPKSSTVWQFGGVASPNVVVGLAWFGKGLRAMIFVPEWLAGGVSFAHLERYFPPQ
jgi:hypothetical protein